MTALPKEEEHSYGRDEVVKIINSVISKVEHTGELSRDTIFKELQALKKVIDDARAEIGSTSPEDINKKHIPTATDELDAVVAATAEATGLIMDACDVIQEKAGALGESGNAINDQVIKIYEACSFQDITGQRITKTVNTLKTIEDKVSKLLNVLGGKISGTGTSTASSDTRTGDAALLNGPQMPGNAITQAEIDKLLSEFD